MEMWKFGIIIFVIQSSNAIAGKSTNILFLNMIYFLGACRCLMLIIKGRNSDFYDVDPTRSENQII
jgi:hypothetical protein